jgi:hypothetical protein
MTDASACSLIVAVAVGVEAAADAARKGVSGEGPAPGNEPEGARSSATNGEGPALGGKPEGARSSATNERALDGEHGAGSNAAFVELPRGVTRSSGTTGTGTVHGALAVTEGSSEATQTRARGAIGSAERGCPWACACTGKVGSGCVSWCGFELSTFHDGPSWLMPRSLGSARGSGGVSATRAGTMARRDGDTGVEEGEAASSVAERGSSAKRARVDDKGVAGETGTVLSEETRGSASVRAEVDECVVEEGGAATSMA